MMETIFQRLRATIEPGEILDVRVGLHWTGVLVRVAGERRLGLATTCVEPGHHYRTWHDVSDPGRLHHLDADSLMDRVYARSPVERSIGLATINALLPRHPHQWQEINAEAIIATAGAHKRVAIIGHFPFTERLRDQVGQLWVLELTPREGDIPATHIPTLLPQADIVAITSTTLINRTLPSVLKHKRPDALTLLLGPSTPLSPVLFDWGIDILSGAVVDNVEAVLSALSQGADFRQLHRLGVRLVSMRSEEKQ